MNPGKKRRKTGVVFIACETDFVVKIWTAGAGAEGLDLGWV